MAPKGNKGGNKGGNKSKGGNKGGNKNTKNTTRKSTGGRATTVSLVFHHLYSRMLY
jgi:hypothetical protein